MGYYLDKSKGKDRIGGHLGTLKPQSNYRSIQTLLTLSLMGLPGQIQRERRDQWPSWYSQTTASSSHLSLQGRDSYRWKGPSQHYLHLYMNRKREQILSLLLTWKFSHYINFCAFHAISSKHKF